MTGRLQAGMNLWLRRGLTPQGDVVPRTPPTPRTTAFMRPLLFLGPALMFLGIYQIYPVFASIWFAFHDQSGRSYVGGTNFQWLVLSAEFRAALVNTVLWLAVVPAASTVLGLLSASLTSQIGWGRIAKMLMVLPMALSSVGAASIWKFVYDFRGAGLEQIGLLNAIVVGLGGEPQAWMALPFWNSFLLMVIVIWMQTGFAMIVLSAALHAIPAAMIEAARIDGANGFQLFFWIIVPQMRGAIAVVFLAIFVITLKVFDVVLAMTNGQWNSKVLAHLMFDLMFRGGGDLGRGAAVALVILILVAPILTWKVANARAGKDG
ncbi:sugar ABC transporter permease [Defluviimonas sp. WL0002]|uniref:Sugar ABC transporter permease n=1 Tax=Albidovulum marisflavi TaxID=2984159 RepID=A0ABT2ZGD1_9RHOB|nr:sugar ABC transporter permease [Defluviimonas sp. WL0002]MCV2870093.1 sugar ABC transporter permease [Defluviimonas sp. WL0002]